MFPECVACVVDQTEQLLQRHCPDREGANEVALEVIRFMASAEHDLKRAPALPVFLDELLERRCGIKKAIRRVCRQQNSQFLQLEGSIRREIAKSINPLQKALQYSLAGNQLVNQQEPIENLESSLASAARLKPVIDDSRKLFDRVRKAGTIVMICDKAGETVTDKLFLEHLHHPGMYYAVREKGMLSEATVEDAQQAGIGAVARIIGIPKESSFLYDVPASHSFGKIYREADVVIAKGHTNFWKLHNETEKETFFLFSANCKVLSGLLKVTAGDPVVMYGKHYQQKIVGMENYETLCHEL
jgi:damage-control phosphatase, subfamily I